MLQTNGNEINKPNKFQVNQTNYKFIETINNNNNDRQNTVKHNLNTLVQITNEQKNGKFNTSFNQSLYILFNFIRVINKEKDANISSKIKMTENLDESKLSKKKKEKNKCFVL
jgi:hypothetical protein